MVMPKPSEEGAHQCRNFECKKQLHSAMSCVDVWMLIEGIYFCDQACLENHRHAVMTGKEIPALDESNFGESIPIRKRLDKPIQEALFEAVHESAHVPAYLWRARAEPAGRQFAGQLPTALPAAATADNGHDAPQRTAFSFTNLRAPLRLQVHHRSQEASV